MKQLFDETNGYTDTDLRRTIWYLFDEPGNVMEAIFGPPDDYGGREIAAGDHQAMIEAFRNLIRSDLEKAPVPEPSETHWIFYSSHINGDAIGDKVRFSIYIRLKEGRYQCNLNITDYIFATSFDAVQKIKNQIEELLNRGSIHNAM